jgi:simple sugar transport system substrate-binding protein
MSRKLALLLILSVIFGLLALAPALAQDEFVFGVVLVGPENDGGWSQAHYEGGLYVEENIPGARMIYFASLNPADHPEATLESVVRDMVDQGARLILTTSDAFELDTDAVAAMFPDVVFVNASGSNALAQNAHDLFPDLVPAPEGEEMVVPSNVGNLMLQIEWAKLVAGCAAALTTETGSIGYLGPLINPETRRLAASAYLGARYCYENYAGGSADELVFNVTWIGFWFNIPGVTLDPTEEVNNFFDGGADVVISGIDTTEAVVVAGQRASEGERVFSVAYDNQAGCDQAPASCLGVPYFNWGPSYAAIAQSVIDGTWEQSWDWVAPNWEDMEQSAVGFLPGEGLSEEVGAGLLGFMTELITFATDEANAGQFFLWQGPLNLQDGTELAAEGEFVDPLEIWYLPQLLEGMGGASQ